MLSIKSNKITVLMCVYNGERFLLKQLESIRNQTCRPDEVIIYDDCSTDSSISLINNFIVKNNLESFWKIKNNSYRKGWRLNFYDAILECNSDYIFFCDHDDIWYSDKISIMSKTMQENPNILVLTGFFKTIDTNGNFINVLDWTSNNIYDKKIVKSNLGESIFSWKQRNGCTMAIKKIIKEQLKHFKRDETFAHDIWSVNIGSLLGGCYHINYPVIQYRVHEDNTAARRTAKKLNKEERKLEIEKKIKYLVYIKNGVDLLKKDLINQNEYHIFLKAINYYNFKLCFINYFNFLNIFKLFIYLNIYIKFIKIKHFFMDILEILKLYDCVRNIKFLILKHDIK